MSEIFLMTVIADRKMAKKYREFFRKNSLTVTFATLGKGTASDKLLSYLGMEATEKIVLLAVVTRSVWKEVKFRLQTDLRIDLPGRGIAFIIPLSSVGGKRVLDYLTMNQTVSVKEESSLKDTTFELLIVIANTGYTDLIMDTAREANAPGGTVIHAKGTGTEEARKFLGVSLAQEKELILMVVHKEQKNPIMSLIMEKAGPHTKAGAISFSLPVTSTVGIRLLEED